MLTNPQVGQWVRFVYQQTSFQELIGEVGQIERVVSEDLVVVHFLDGKRLSFLSCKFDLLTLKEVESVQQDRRTRLEQQQDQARRQAHADKYL